MSRAVRASMIAAVLAAPTRADAGCDDGDGQGYDYWDGHLVFEPQVGFAAGRFLVVEQDDVIALDVDGAEAASRQTALAADLNTRRIASSPTAHLVFGMSDVLSGDLVADVLGPEGDDVARGVVIAAEPAGRNFETPAAAWNGTAFDLAWIANEGWGNTAFWVYVARVDASGAVLTTAREIASGKRSSGATTQPVIAVTDGATWLVWDAEHQVEQPDGVVEVHPAVVGMRLDEVGVPLDAAPIVLAMDHALTAAAARGGEVLVVARDGRTFENAIVRIDANGAIGTPTPVALGLEAFSIPAYSARLVGRPDGYLMAWATSASLTAVRLDPTGLGASNVVEGSGDMPAVVDGNGDAMLVAAHDERRGSEGTSRLEVTHVFPDNAIDGPIVLREHDLDLEHSGCGCSAADGGGLLPALVALLAIALSRRSRPSGSRAARAATRSTRSSSAPRSPRSCAARG